jgi:hypothetical protein
MTVLNSTFKPGNVTYTVNSCGSNGYDITTSLQNSHASYKSHIYVYYNDSVYLYNPPDGISAKDASIITLNLMTSNDIEYLLKKYEKYFLKFENIDFLKKHVDRLLKINLYGR